MFNLNRLYEFLFGKYAKTSRLERIDTTGTNSFGPGYPTSSKIIVGPS